MNFSRLAQLRLANQQISSQKFSTPAALAGWLGGLQAQDYPAVRWALALRLKAKATDAGIERAIAGKTILRTWCMRGTIHLVAARDAAWMIDVTAPRPLNSAKPVERLAGLDEATFAKSNKLLARELKGGQPMERDAIYNLFEKSGISITGQRGYYLLWRAGMTGLICFGPQLNKKPTFAPAGRLRSQSEKTQSRAGRCRISPALFSKPRAGHSGRLDLVERPRPCHCPRRA